MFHPNTPPVAGVRVDQTVRRDLAHFRGQLLDNIAVRVERRKAPTRHEFLTCQSLEKRGLADDSPPDGIHFGEPVRLLDAEQRPCMTMIGSSKPEMFASNGMLPLCVRRNIPKGCSSRLRFYISAASGSASYAIAMACLCFNA